MEEYDKGNHYSNSMDDSYVKMAGDVVPILKNLSEEYPGQKGVIGSTGDLSQHLNNMRQGSNRTNVVPIKRPGQ